MAVLLVVACLAVAGAELYLAFGRSRRETAERTAQREAADRMTARVEEALGELAELRADLAGRPEAADLARLTKRTAELAQGQQDLTASLRRHDELAGYVGRIEERAGRTETSVSELHRTLTSRVEAALARHEAALAELRAEQERQAGDAVEALAEARRVHADQTALADAVTAEHARQGAALEEALDELRQSARERTGELATELRTQGVRVDLALSEVRALGAREGGTDDLRRIAAELEELRTADAEHAVRLADALAELRDTRAEQDERLAEAVLDLRERIAEAADDAQDGVREGAPRALAALAEPGALDAVREELLSLRGRTDLALDRLDELDAERDRDLERYRDLAQALDAVEDHLAGQPSTDGEATTLRGGLVGAQPLSHELLSKAYENLVDALDLRVRMQVPAGESPWHTQYYLAGKNPARLRRDFVALLDGLRGTAADPRRDALHALALELQAADEAFAQIGPFVMVHVQESLLCGVLTVAEARRFDIDRFLGDPSSAVSGLRLLPEQRFRDLGAEPLTA
ncbi:hypothetical protein [Actinocorallia sp. A-T 12471]|uniref:hypothetical protein n=1 Tax=Actinocorallia sp. A-T 12471 TaxID=3089813 RepID=UPI0029CBA7B1|nr:hypothetical protein [Actinocorallia sp. A-T 12471]MDX6740089.1 hypothetical protein [Actinocorallia sp. A-T 12471]